MLSFLDQFDGQMPACRLRRVEVLWRTVIVQAGWPDFDCDRVPWSKSQPWACKCKPCSEGYPHQQVLQQAQQDVCLHSALMCLIQDDHLATHSTLHWKQTSAWLYVCIRQRCIRITVSASPTHGSCNKQALPLSKRAKTNDSLH